jgi:hypothetical protein
MEIEVIANRLVNELMLVSVLVAGKGAPAFAAALVEAGAAAEALADGDAQVGFDLAVLLGDADPDEAPDDMAGLASTLALASERLLFVPLAAAGDEVEAEAPALPGLTRWFEIFAELGYQPVVDFDAGFVATGAFLVDRGATAAESELAAFADRLQGAPMPAAVRTAPEPGPDAALPPAVDALLARVAGQEAQIAALGAAAAEAEAALQQASFGNEGWDGLRTWVNFSVRDPGRDCEAALLRDLPRLRALRGPDAPPLDLSVSEAGRPRGWLSRLFRRAARAAPDGTTAALLADTALVRASIYFDPAWYIASSPELCAGEPIDPVFHYVFVGGARGADPGPWFDTASYLAAHPEAASGAQCPLLHAIRSGAAEVRVPPQGG